jgi:hypothetical protein
MRPLCSLPGDRNARRQELSRVLAVTELESQPVRDGQLIDTPAGSEKQAKQIIAGNVEEVRQMFK